MQVRLAGSSEKIARDRLTYSAWGSRLTLDQFLGREERLRATAWTSRDMRTWLLCDGDQILASCETFAIPAWQEGSETRIQAIASVFTEERMRGRGHATRLIDMLCSRLESEERHAATVLYSDVGAAIYERAGFVLRPSRDRRWTALSSRSDLSARSELSGGSAVRLLSREELNRAWADFRHPQRAFLAWPSPEQIDWHLEREQIYRELLRAPESKAAGARLGNSLIAWTIDHKKQLLQILALLSEKSHEADELISAARDHAARAGISQVIAWSTEAYGDWDRLREPGSSVAREDSLPMIRSQRIKPEDWDIISRSCWV